MVFPSTVDEKTSDFIRKLKNEDMELFFTDLSESMSRRKINLPSTDSAVKISEENGIKVARTHFSPTGFKSDKPLELINTLIQQKKG